MKIAKDLYLDIVDRVKELGVIRWKVAKYTILHNTGHMSIHTSVWL